MRKCRGCGAEIPGNAPFGHCPNCLLERGFGPLPDEMEVPSPTDASSGRTFGEYELLEQIGRGGMGVIYKARQVTLNRLVALKMINAGELATPTMIQRFHLEAESAANLHHPNIVPIYETGEHQGQHFFSMELIDGVGLDRHIIGGGFSGDQKSGKEKTSSRARQEQIARITAKVARAVDYAHQHGVLHRDIKPSNVLLDSRGEPRLTDFGVAKIVGHTGSGLTASGAIMGTPSYMAPEQAAGQGKRVTIAADIYSLGAVLYAMLTGHPPFHAETPVQTLKQVVEDEPKHPTTFGEGIDRDLATICMKCLEKEPRVRYSSATALAEDLERWLRREPIMARPINTAERLWRWSRRNPRVATLGAAVALLLVVVAVGATVFAFQIKNLNRHLHKQVLNSLVKVYEDPSTPSFVVESDVRRALFGDGQGRVVPGPLLELTYVEDVYEHPTNMLATLSPILRYVEDNLSARFRRPVAIRLLLCKTSETEQQALESTNLTIGRMGPSGYAKQLNRSNGVRMLAMQDHKNPLTMAIFTRTNSEIARLADSQPNVPLSGLLAGRSVLFSGTNSMTGNFMAKRFLASQGIYATNLARYEYRSGQRRVIDAVLNNTFEVGAGNLENLENYPALRVIATNVAPGLGRCWVAGTGMDATTEASLRACLLGLKDPEILGKLESETKGFIRMEPKPLELLHEIIRGAAAFDAGKNPGTP